MEKRECGSDIDKKILSIFQRNYFIKKTVQQFYQHLLVTC